MRKILTITYYEILKNIRDIKMLFIIIVSPIILIFILGSSVGAFLTLEYMPTPVVGYVNLDQGEMSQHFKSFIFSNEVIEIMETKEFSNSVEADLAMENGEVDCIIFINDQFSFHLMNNEEAQIEVYGKGNSSYVEAVVNNYINIYNLSIALIQNDIEPISEYNQVQLERGQLNTNSSYPNAIDYYSVQTLLQILLLCSVFGISIILRDYDQGLKLRINSTPVTKFELISGRMMGSIFYSFISAMVIILFSKFVYGANWNGNSLIIGLSILLFVIIAVGFGVLIASITKHYTTSFGVLALISFVLPAASGAFSPKSTVKVIGLISPNYYAKNIIFGTIYDYPKSVILNGFIGLCLIGIIIYGLIIFFERRNHYATI